MEINQDLNKPVDDNSLDTISKKEPQEQRPANPESTPNAESLSAQAPDAPKDNCCTSKKNCCHPAILVCNIILLIGLILLFFVNRQTHKNPYICVLSCTDHGAETEALKAAGAKRALPLSVSGAFHSPLMEPARVELAKAIERTEVHTPKCPIYQNVTALPETDPKRIKDNLLQQLTSPVRWTQSVKNMLADGATEFRELGPGAVLQGLVKRIATAAGAEVTIL